MVAGTRSSAFVSATSLRSFLQYEITQAKLLNVRTVAAAVRQVRPDRDSNA